MSTTEPTEDTECPTCGRDDFSSAGGMKRHHFHTHGESIAGVECICEGCNDSFRVDPHRAENARYCSEECTKQRATLVCEGCGQEYTVPQSRKDTSTYCSVECTSRRETLTCEGCGDEFDVPQSRAEKARFCSMECRKQRVSLVCDYCGEEYSTTPSLSEKRRFCSTECNSKSARERLSNSATVNCEVCGDEYTVPASTVDRTSYCSMECLSKGYSDRQTTCCEVCGSKFQVKNYRKSDARFCSHLCMGVYYHEDRGGAHPNLYYGPNWDEQSRKARRRDQYRCQDCGMTEPEHLAEHGRKHPVHHITPIREFRDDGDLDHEAANDLNNLITLCDGCHAKWEQMAPLRPDTAAAATSD